MVAGSHLQLDPELGELAGLTGIAADWPLEQWRAEAAAVEAAEDAALARARASSGTQQDAHPILAPPPSLPSTPLPSSLPPSPRRRPGRSSSRHPSRSGARPPSSARPGCCPLSRRRSLLPTRTPSGRADASDERGTRAVLASSRTMAIASLASRVTGFLRSIALVAALGTGLVVRCLQRRQQLPQQRLRAAARRRALERPDPAAGARQRARRRSRRRLHPAAAVDRDRGARRHDAGRGGRSRPRSPTSSSRPGPQRTLASTFATLLLPEIFFYGLGAMFVAVLNTRQIYGPGAWAPVANNAITIVTVVIYLAVPGPAIPTPATMTNTQILVLGIGTTLGIVAQAFILRALASARRVPVDVALPGPARTRPAGWGRRRGCRAGCSATSPSARSACWSSPRSPSPSAIATTTA